MKFITTMLGILLVPAMALAHHSRAEFSGEVQEIEGELVEVAWRNPHPVLTVRVVNDAGEERLLGLESWQSANSLLRKGVTGDIFTVGGRIRAAVQTSSRRPNVLLGTSVSLGNGTQAILRPGLEPYWPGEAVVGAEGTLGGDAAAARSEAQGLFRVWTYRERQGVADLPLTAAARERLAAFDELEDHPLWNCDPVGMPVAMDSALPIEFIDRGDEILLRIEQNDNTRTIHMSASAAPDSQAATAMGYSVGRWEGSTLVVTTTNSDYPYFDDDGVPKSPAMEIVERFTVGAGGGSLRWEATMTDPAYLSEPVTISAVWDWVPGETIEEWNCALSG